MIMSFMRSGRDPKTEDKRWKRWDCQLSYNLNSCWSCCL
jgi:hypothetical protein